jgi:hypothetical protein
MRHIDVIVPRVHLPREVKVKRDEIPLEILDYDDKELNWMNED